MQKLPRGVHSEPGDPGWWAIPEYGIEVFIGGYPVSSKAARAILERAAGLPREAEVPVFDGQPAWGSRRVLSVGEVLPIDVWHLDVAPNGSCTAQGFFRGYYDPWDPRPLPLVLDGFGLVQAQVDLDLVGLQQVHGNYRVAAALIPQEKPDSASGTKVFVVESGDPDDGGLTPVYVGTDAAEARQRWRDLIRASKEYFAEKVATSNEWLADTGMDETSRLRRKFADAVAEGDGRVHTLTTWQGGAALPGSRMACGFRQRCQRTDAELFKVYDDVADLVIIADHPFRVSAHYVGEPPREELHVNYERLRRLLEGRVAVRRA